jgi:uncharacterized protein (DUF302 family)
MRIDPICKPFSQAVAAAFGAALLGLSFGASAQSITVAYDGNFEDATFGIENAIIDKGLVIDYVSHVGDMLNRTGADLGSDVVIFDSARIYLFCSAVVSRKVMEANPDNVAFCPYSVFVTDKDGQVEIGYQDYPEGPMDIVEELLGDIVAAATE